MTDELDNMLAGFDVRTTVIELVPDPDFEGSDPDAAPLAPTVLYINATNVEHEDEEEFVVVVTGDIDVASNRVTVTVDAFRNGQRVEMNTFDLNNSHVLSAPINLIGSNR